MRRRSLQHGNGEAAMGEQRKSASKGLSISLGQNSVGRG